MTRFSFVTIGLIAVTIFACKRPSLETGTEGFGRGYSAKPQAQAIACSLIRAGFHKIPRSTIRSAGALAQYNSSFFANRDMVDLFTCIADAESTLGTDPKTNSGSPKGVLQVQNFHSTSGEFPECTGANLKQLDANTRCAAAVFRAQGIRAWEVIALGSCKAKQVEKVRCNDSSLESRRGGSCGEGFSYGFSADGRHLTVNAASGCGATKAVAVLMQIENGRAVVESPGLTGVFKAQGSRKETAIVLGAARQANHTHVRILLMQNNEEFYRTNPSPALPPLVGSTTGTNTVDVPYPVDVQNNTSGNQVEPADSGYFVTPQPLTQPVDRAIKACESHITMSSCLFAADGCDWTGSLFSGTCFPK